MLLLLDDAKHQRNQSHTPHKHQQCHQQLAVVSQPRGKVQTGPHRAQCRHTLEGNGQKRRTRLQNADDENKHLISGIVQDLDSHKNLVYTSRIKLDASFTIQYLNKIGFEWNAIDINYIVKCINYFKKIKFIN